MSLSYDNAGNREKVIDTGTDDYVTNALNQYNQAGSYYLDYDLTGNLGACKTTSYQITRSDLGWIWS